MLEGPVQPDAAAGEAGATLACEPLRTPLSAILGFAELMRAGLAAGAPAERMDALALAIIRTGEAGLALIAAAAAAEAASPSGGD